MCGILALLGANVGDEQGETIPIDSLRRVVARRGPDSVQDLVIPVSSQGALNAPNPKRAQGFAPVQNIGQFVAAVLHLR